MQSILKGEGFNGNKIEITAKCTQGNLSALACNNEKCDEYAFVCHDKNCLCRAVHKKCLFTCPERILQIIQQKRAESNQIIDKVSLIFDRWIDEISRTRENIQNILSDWGLSGSQKKFMQLLRSSQYKQLSGHHIHEISTSTTSYYQLQVKEKLLSQITNTYKNYDSQIKRIMGTFTGLFDKFELKQKDIHFKQDDQLKVSNQIDLIIQLNKYRSEVFKPNVNLGRKDYEDFIIFIKDLVKKDFQNHMHSFRKERRAYGSHKLRMKYSEHYISVINIGYKHILKWQAGTERQMKDLNKSMEADLVLIAKYYREIQCHIQNPFTPDMALSLQKAISVIFMLVDLIKRKGKQLIQPYIDEGLETSQRFNMAIFFLDILMDKHPEIDQIDLIWTVIRFDDKLKNEVNLLYDTMTQMIKQSIPVQVSV